MALSVSSSVKTTRVQAANLRSQGRRRRSNLRPGRQIVGESGKPEKRQRDLSIRRAGIVDGIRGIRWSPSVLDVLDRSLIDRICSAIDYSHEEKLGDASKGQ